jgi:hypothetical protein
MSAVTTREKGTSGMNVEAILKRLRGVRVSRNGWIAACPAHDDRSPSLSIDERDRKILLYCHAGCSTEAVCAALGIKMSELFSEPRTEVNPEPRIVRAMQRQIATVRARLTPRERERPVTVVLAKDCQNLDAALARALALAVEGELVQVILARGAE